MKNVSPSQATPGPWHAQVSNRPDRMPTLIWNEEETVNLASVYGSSLEAVANARLIAAAPDLLEALKNIENDDGSIPPVIWKMRNDAIAKAEQA